MESLGGGAANFVAVTTFAACVALLYYLYHFFFFVPVDRRWVKEGFSDGGDGSDSDQRGTGARPREDSELVCVVATGSGGDKYCVRDRGGARKTQEAVDLLARVTMRIQNFVIALKAKYPDNEDVGRLHRNFDRTAVAEILPDSTFEAVTTNKGEEVEFCLLRSKNDVQTLIDDHTLTFVALHEITHIMCKEENHPPLFWAQFRFLLKEAKELGVHEPRDYAKEPAKYCDRDINESPFFQWKKNVRARRDGGSDEYVP